jgi:hypothetical protein
MELEGWDFARSDVEEGREWLRLSLITWPMTQSIWLHNRIPIKTLDTEVPPEWTHPCDGKWCSWLLMDNKQKLCLWGPLRPCPLSVFIWLSLSCILWNKTVIVSIVLSWVLWVTLANYQTWVGYGNPWFCSQWESRWPGDPIKLWWASVVGTVLRRPESLMYGVCASLGPEMNCSVSIGVETE